MFYKDIKTVYNSFSNGGKAVNKYDSRTQSSGQMYRMKVNRDTVRPESITHDSTGYTYNLPEYVVTPQSNPDNGSRRVVTLEEMAQQAAMNKAINEGMNRAGNIGFEAAMLASMFPAAITAPVTTGLGILGGTAGSSTGAKIGQYLAGDEGAVYGGLVGGLIGGGLGAGATSSRIRSLMNSPHTGKWTKFGNKEYRLNPNSLGADGVSLESKPVIPEGYSLVKQLQLRTKDGIKTVHQIKNNETGKFAILESLDNNQFVVNKSKASSIVDLANYRGEKLTGNEPGFDEWALSRVPENDHFANLSHGVENPEELLPIINEEFESLPNGSRIDLGETFSGDISANLLQYAYRHKDRIKMVLPKNLNSRVSSNDHGIKGAKSAADYNDQLDRLLQAENYPHDIVSKAIYDEKTNRVIGPKLSFIKLHRNGGKLKWN